LGYYKFKKLVIACLFQAAGPKTAQIAGAARAYTLLISCIATKQAESTKK
jgi:hypothetical protein